MKTCSIEGCGKPVSRRVWCGAHYGRYLRYGDPRGLPKRKTLLEKFNDKILKQDDGCWIWTGAKTKEGSPRIRYTGGRQHAKHVAYELYKHPVPRGMHVFHKCNVRLCVNPKHLYLKNYTGP